MKKRIWIGALLVLAMMLASSMTSMADAGDCQMTVSMPQDLQDAGATVSIRYGPTGLKHGEHV